MAIFSTSKKVWDWCVEQGFEMKEHVINEAAEVAASKVFETKILPEDENLTVLYLKGVPVEAYFGCDILSIEEIREGGINI